MRFISTNVHGPFDYLFGVYLVSLPWLFGYASIGGPETWIPVTLGVGVIVYSLLTDYEWGLAKRIAMPGHLTLDLLVGATLLFCIPFFGFFDTTLWLPHSLGAIVIIAAGLLTRTEPESARPFFPYKDEVMAA